MDKVTYLIVHIMKKVNHNRKRILVLLEEEGTVLEVILMLTLGITILVKEKIYLCLKTLILNVDKDI